MAVIKGFPGTPSELTSAVRKALFTTAAVTAISVGTPGYAAAAEIACAPGELGAPMAGDTVICTGAFDESIGYDVADMTVVDETTGEVTVDPETGDPIVVAGDITVVVAEGSTASGVVVSSTTAAGANEEAQGSVTIENSGDIEQGAGGAIEVDSSLTVELEEHGIKFLDRTITAGNNPHSGYWWGSYVAIDEDGNPVGEVTEFDRKVTNQELDEYLSIDPSSSDYSNRDYSAAGPEDVLSFIHAEEGTFESGAIGAISAQTEAGSITISNSGDLTVGNGQAITYYSDYGLRNGTGTFTEIDTDGDGVKDIKVYGGYDQVLLSDEDIHQATLYSAGIAAKSTTGNILVENTGAIASGDISKAINAVTEEGDISVNNSGDIETGAYSVGIEAGSAVVTEVAHSYSYTSSSAYAVEFEEGRISFSHAPGGTAVEFDAPYYTHFIRDYTVNAHNVDGSDSVIVIENTGGIHVGTASIGIKATNPSGDEIIIQNSGDISVGEGIGGAGIYASTNALLATSKENVHEGCNPFFYDCSKPYYTIAEGEADPGNVESGLTSREEYNGTEDLGIEGDGTIEFNGATQYGVDPYTGQMDILLQTGNYYTHTAPVGEHRVFETPRFSIEYDLWTGEYTEVETKHYTYLVDWEANGYFDDRGDIAIGNSGNIDMSGTYRSAAIHAIGNGTTSILNTGDIQVGKISQGILSQGVGETVIDNQGDMYLHGAGSTGIMIQANPGILDSVELTGVAFDETTAAMFGGFENGDVTIVNSGNIAAADNSHLTEYNENGALVARALWSRGMDVTATNSNMLGSAVKWSQYGQDVVDEINAESLARHEATMAAYEAGEITADEVSEYSKIEIDDSIELGTVSILNTGDISLSNFSHGIDVAAHYGTVIVENQGSISVGDGQHSMSPHTYSATTIKSQGITVDNFGNEGFADHFILNSGDVTTGSTSNGIASYSWHGSSYVINEGNVTVGSGHLIDASETEYRERSHGSNSTAIVSVVAGGWDSYALAQNSGNITTGDRAYGMVASNVFTTHSLLTDDFSHNYTAAAINTGVITTGDRSSGMAVNGYITLGYNSGEINIGSGLMRNGSYDTVAAGMRTLLDTGLAATLYNKGSITGGDEVAGMYAGAFYAASIQGADGSITVGDDAAGIVARARIQASAVNQGMVETGDNSTGIQALGVYAAAQNTGTVVVGDDSIGMEAYGTLAQAINTGTIVGGDNSVGIQLSSAGINQVDQYGNVVGSLVGAVVNYGNIRVSGDDGYAIRSTEDFDVQILNRGDIEGSIRTGAGDDFLYNAVQTDENGYLVGAGTMTLTDDKIDLGEGENIFRNVFGDILFSGDNVIELGSGRMDNYSSGESYVTISSINGDAGDTLTINGDVNFTTIQGKNGLFLIDVSNTAHDKVVINGDLTVSATNNAGTSTTPSSLGVAMNVLEQGKGEITTGAVIDVNGNSDMGDVVLTAIGGDFADTIVNAEMQQNGNGDWVIAYTAGLSHLGAAASSVSHLAESFWQRSASAIFAGERSANASENGRGEGLSAWSTAFHTDSDIDSKGDIAGQSLGFTQLISGQIAGATYATKLGDSWLSISPMVGLGSADGSQLQQQSSAALDTETFALNGSWSMSDFYVNAMVQNMEFDAHVKSYDSGAMTSGKAFGASFEGGWTYLMESGIAMTSFAQWSDVKVEIDDFTSSDGNYDYAYNLGSTSRTSVGLNLSKSYSLKDGFAVPYATFNLANSSNHDAHDLHSNGVSFNSDVSGSEFGIDLGVDGKYKQWTFKTGVGIYDGEVDKNGLNARFSVYRSL